MTARTAAGPARRGAAARRRPTVRRRAPPLISPRGSPPPPPPPPPRPGGWWPTASPPSCGSLTEWKLPISPSQPGSWSASAAAYRRLGPPPPGVHPRDQLPAGLYGAAADASRTLPVASRVYLLRRAAWLPCSSPCNGGASPSARVLLIADSLASTDRRQPDLLDAIRGCSPTSSR